MKQTNTERAGRGCRGARAASGGKKVEEGDGKKPERAKARGRRHFKRPAHASSPFRLLSSPRGARCRRSRPGLRVQRVERELKGEKETPNGGGAAGTATLDSYNCSFLQIPRFLPATAKFGNL